MTLRLKVEALAALGTSASAREVSKNNNVVKLTFYPSLNCKMDQQETSGPP